MLASDRPRAPARARERRASSAHLTANGKTPAAAPEPDPQEDPQPSPFKYGDRQTPQPEGDESVAKEVSTVLAKGWRPRR